jgi:hypothetical protein
VNVKAAGPSASAVTKVYAGTTGTGAQMAMDVKFDRHGVPRKITEVRGMHIPIVCDQSGADNDAIFVTPVSIKIAHDKFSYDYTDPYGNHSSLVGRLTGNKRQKATGHFFLADHLLAGGGYPEENCTSADQTFSLKRGAPDVRPPGFRPQR